MLSGEKSHRNQHLLRLATSLNPTGKFAENASKIADNDISEVADGSYI